MTHRIVVMGVSGCGKSTLGAALATALGLPFLEGDSLHPPENIARMAAGLPLDDAMRIPFLRNVADALAAWPGGAVASCSALRRGYRDMIRERADGVRFVLPLVSRDTLLDRISARVGHFMPPSLLDSQLETLELPDAEETAVCIDGSATLDHQIATVMAALAEPPLQAH